MIYSEKKFETGELSDGGCDIKFLHFHFLQKSFRMATRTLLKLRHDVSCTTSRRIICCVTTYHLLRHDVSFAASGRIFYCIGMHLLLRQDVSFTASERIFLPLLLSKIAKND